MRKSEVSMAIYQRDLALLFYMVSIKYYFTSSILLNFHPSNCMIILCSWVP